MKISKNKMKILITVGFLIILLTCGSAEICVVHARNNEKAEQVIDMALDGQYSKEYNIKKLEECLELKLLDEVTKMKLHSNISIFYGLSRNYAKMIENAVSAIYFADDSKNYYYSASNYINLSEAFSSLYDYETAETLIQTALGYEIDNPEDEVWIKETAYVYLADLKSKSGETDEARKYLELSNKYIAKTAYDYEEMMMKRQIILARTYWNEGDYPKVKEILNSIPEIDIKNEILLADVYIPLKEMQAKLKLAEGNFEESELLCDEVLRQQKEYGYCAESLRFLTEITPLYKDVNSDLFNKYTSETLNFYSIVMENSNDMTSDYILSIYGSEFFKFHEMSRIFLAVTAAIIVGMLMIFMTIMLLHIRNQSIRDPLTNLYNRRYFKSVYKRYIKKKSGFALILIDIDYFKNINDSYGHDFGDNVLINICRVFMNIKYRNAKIFRVGGEEFCILYRCRCLEDAVLLAEDLRKDVETLTFENESEVTISAGVAFCGQSEDLYNLADRNLYMAKNSGRNKVSYTCCDDC